MGSGSLIDRWEPSSAHRALRDEVARAFDVEPCALVSRSRKRPTVRARQAAVWVIKARWPRMSWTMVARTVNIGDHSSALHAHRRAEDRRTREADFAAVTDALVAGAPVPPVRPIVVAKPLPPRCPVADAMAGRSVKPKNDFAEDDRDGMRRARGSMNLAAALKRAGFA